MTLIVNILVFLNIAYVISRARNVYTTALPTSPPGEALKYEQGKSYKYIYETSVLFNDVDKNGSHKDKNVGYNIQMDLEISVVHQLSDSQLFKLKISKAMVGSVSRPNQEKSLGSLLKYPFYFEVERDTVNSVYMVEQDSIFSINIKKGIAALFQVQQESGQKSEIDVSGDCSVIYSKSSDTIIKTKQKCQNLEISGQFSTSNPIAGVTVNGITTLIYDINNGIINKVDSKNTVTGTVNVRTSINGETTSRQNLVLKETVLAPGSNVEAASIQDAVSIIEKEIGKSLILSLLPSGSEQQQCGEKCKPATDLAFHLKDDLVNEKVSTLTSAKAFLKMVKSFRNSGKNTIAEVFSSPDSYYIIPQLIDIAVAAQTTSAHEALMELLHFQDDSTVVYIERYLLAAAYITHPDEFILNDMLAHLKQTTATSLIREPLLLSLSSIVYTYCQIKHHCDKQIVKDIESLILNSIKECDKDEPCLMRYVQALGNAAFPSSIPVLLHYGENAQTTMLSFTAINALRRISTNHFTPENKRSLLRIFHQTTKVFDSSVRVIALNTLLRVGLSVSDLREILQTCQYQHEFELSTYIVRKILDEADIDKNLREKLSQVLKESIVNNYNVLSQRGKSSSLTSYLTNSKEFNSTYSLSFETTDSGIMKRSGMLVNLFGENWKHPVLHFDIYAEGLESLVGESSEERDEEDITTEAAPDGDENIIDPTAGMALTLFDVLLRQIEFFKGTAGLMSAAWNAPSELTPALQVNILLQDHSEKIHLSNGMIVTINIQGAMSIDLSGLVSISLWNRNSHSVIKNSGSLYINGEMKLESTVFNSGIKFSGESESVTDFITDAEFYEMPLKLCLQMERPELVYRQKVFKFEKLKGFKSYNQTVQQVITIPSKSFLLNHSNSKQCKLMFPEE